MTTHPLDAVREMDKVIDALERAATHLARMNESNAALHLSEQVLYSPLTVITYQARGSAEQVRAYLSELATGERAAPHSLSEAAGETSPARPWGRSNGHHNDSSSPDPDGVGQLHTGRPRLVPSRWAAGTEYDSSPGAACSRRRQ